ncbi:MAG: hypothetical protein E7I40_06990 [Finegoldia magna]|uniref:hypothetical protein n=1 Tax=Finegoldia magna TaxID=1260 RepID=UPI002910A288|nr:hypothetical protein [Finegoldia magna]MDU4334690.1 hypothetical protein [Finegoldia magna]
MKILESTQKDSLIVIKMATKIRQNQKEDELELEGEFKEILQLDEESNRIICFKKDL